MTWQPWVTEVTLKGAPGMAWARFGEPAHARQGRGARRIAQLDAELAARQPDRGPEPELGEPRPDGYPAGLQPLAVLD